MAKANSGRIKQDASACPVPQTRDAVIEAIAEIGRRQRERERIQAAMNDELAKIKERYETAAAPHNDAITALSRGVRTWCESNRELLTGSKTKTVILPSGEVKWRMRPRRVVVRAAESVIDTLKQLGMQRFVRVKEGVNKEAVLADPQAVAHVKGISITQGEDFVIIPYETELEEVAV